VYLDEIARAGSGEWSRSAAGSGRIVTSFADGADLSKGDLLL